MIAYNPVWLSNLFVREQAAEAWHQNCLDKDEWEDVNNKYPAQFYSPNFFIRIGLFILTTVILLFTFGLFSLFFLNSIDKSIGGLAVFFAMLCYAALEYMVQTKKHFQSGVDDALLWASAGCLFGGISFISQADGLVNCLYIFIISLYGTLRFADRAMSFVLFLSMLGIFFFIITGLGATAKAIVPFAIMAVSAITYLLIIKPKRLKTNLLYRNCIQVISITALLSFYFSGNYYVVRELSNAMFKLNLAGNESIPLGWVFWVLTMGIPFFYILIGIQRKDIVLIRVGLLLTAVIIFTVKYYYAVAPVELEMVAGGIVLMLVSYGFTGYLKSPRNGFTNLETASADTMGKIQMESILQLQTLTGQPAAADGTNFGGGSFGGGGASSEF